jgi:hypothetical protein
MLQLFYRKQDEHKGISNEKAPACEGQKARPDSGKPEVLNRLPGSGLTVPK